MGMPTSLRRPAFIIFPVFLFLGRFILRFDFFGLYLQSRNESNTFLAAVFAEIAQLVERNLAKVEVAGPSPVFRSEGLREIKQ